MLKKQYEKMKRIAYLAIICCVFTFSSIPAHAVPTVSTLPGIEKIGLLNNRANVFTVAEIVADKNGASFGYLVGGEEPIYNGKSLRDMPVADEREYGIGLFEADHSRVDSLITSGMFSYSQFQEVSTGSNVYEIRGNFFDDSDGEYSYITTAASYAPIEEDTPDADTLVKYKQYVDFVPGNEYGVTFHTTEGLLMKDLVIDGVPVYKRYSINTEPLISYEGMPDRLQEINHEAVFEQGYDSNGLYYSYFGSVLYNPAEERAMVLDTNGAMQSITSSLYILRISESKSGNFAITSCVDLGSNGAYAKQYFYEVDSEGTFYKTADAVDGMMFHEDKSGDLRFEANYGAVRVDTVRYNGGFSNSEWLKKNVLDVDINNLDEFYCDVKVLTIDDINSLSSEQLSDIDLFVFRSGSGNIETDKAKQIYQMVKESKVPAVIENGFAATNGSGNNSKLATLLRQTSITKTYKDVNDNWDSNSFWTGLRGTVNNSADMYVEQNVLSVPGTFVGADFISPVSDALQAGGFKKVKDEIESENLLLQNSGSSDRVSTTVSKAAALRYIINYNHQRVLVKSSIDVLEIEPCYSFAPIYAEGGSDSNSLRRVAYLNREFGIGNYYLATTTVNSVTREVLTKQKISTWATQFASNYNSAINLKQSYTKEFIGKVEDLNEKYDMIYIGLDTSTMNTRISGNAKTNNTVYNDSSLNGLVYTHMGDYARVTSSLAWAGGRFGDRARFSGNDITLQKLNEIKQFIDAGYPVVFASGFFYSGTVNASKIDRSSYMYQLAQYALGKTNVFVESDLDSNNEVRNRLADCLNTSKLTVNMDQWPIAYSEGTQYLQKIDGVYKLSYAFSLRNDALVRASNETYDVDLFIDTSADGRFSAEEEITNLEIYKKVGYEWVKELPVGKKYQLVAGYSYKLERKVPTSYTGVLPWKLVFTQNSNSSVRKSQSGYTAIKPDEKERINVLQIKAASGNTLDLSSSAVRNLTSRVNEFDIHVTTTTTTSFINSYGGTQEYCYSYLKDFDMLVIGFADYYTFGSNDNKTQNSVKAIKQYIQSGRSVLFTHDTTSFHNTYNSWGYYFNQYIRSIVGMDRYNVMGELTSMHDNPLLNGNTDTYLQGYTDSTIQRFQVTDFYVSSLGNRVQEYGSTSRPMTASSSSDTRGGINLNTGGETVTKVNDGQITNYPFQIPDNFVVANTHGQYYQLNLDTVTTDDDDDIVVWYCISDANGNTSDDIYQMNPNDVRNNYYIYNKGNITYSGVGHSTVSGDTELKLFVNTMVAAYRAGVHPPKLNYTETSAPDAASIYTTYMPYDKATSTYLDDSVDMYFEISDSNFIQGTPVLNVKYYVESADGAVVAGGPKDSAGNAIKIKEFTPVSLKAGATEVSDVNILQTDVRYAMNVSRASLGNENIDVDRVYISTEMIYYSEELDEAGNPKYSTSSGVGFYEMKVIRTELFNLR